MPGFLGYEAILGTKAISASPGIGLAVPHPPGLVLLFSTATGQPEAMVDAEAVTAWRTAAASGAATGMLARPEAEVLAPLGSGRQAQTHLVAMLAVRPVRRGGGR